MATSSSNKAEELAAAAMEQLPQTRLTFVDQSCGSDERLRAKVHELLKRLESSPDILAMPAGGADPPGHGVSSTRQSALVEAPGSYIGNYRILQPIGEGGFGNVYMAEQERPIRRRVALKIIKLGMDTNQVIARFEVERQALAMMDHPNIAKVLDAGATDTGRPYFVMELVRGVPITSYCDSERLSTKRRLQLFIPVCRAVQHAHQKGIIHRDLKPSNVMITISDGIAIPKIIDFGIAKATNALLTERTYFTEYRQLIGTPEYMSPEQAEASGIDIDTRSDIYSLGVLLYELLTGTTPLDPKALRSLSYGEIQRLIRDIEPPKPSTRVSTLAQTLSTIATQRRTEPRRLGQMLRGELDWIVMKCLEKDRTRRYEAAASLANDIQRHLDNERVVARPATTAYRLQKFISRHTRGVAITAAVVLMVFALLIGLAIATYRLNVARKSETHQRQLANDALIRERAAAAAADQNLINGLIMAGDKFTSSGHAVEAREYYLHAWNAAQSHGVSDLPAIIALLSSSGEMPLMGSFGESGGVGGFNGHSNHVTSVVLRKDGRTAITASEDMTLGIWDVLTGRPIGEALKGHSGGVAMVALSSDDRTLVSSTHNGEVWIWDLQTRQRTHDLSAGTIGVWALAISPNGQFLVAGSKDGRIHRWDIRQQIPLPDFGERHRAAVANLAFSPDGSKVLSGGQDSQLILWDFASGTRLKNFTGHSAPINSVAFAPDGRSVISGAFDWKVIHWSLETDKSDIFYGHSDWVWRVAVSRDGRWAVSAGRDQVRRWDMRSAEQVGNFTGQYDEAMGVAISDDGTAAVATGLGSKLRVWDLRPDEGIGPGNFPDPLTSLAISNERMILMGSAGGRLMLWDAAARRKLQDFAGHAGVVRDAVISSDGKTALSAGDDGVINHWDLASGKSLRQLRGHQDRVNCVAFINDEWAISGGSDASIRVWSLKKTQPPKMLSGHTAGVAAISVAADGQTALSAGKDGTARLWSLSSGSEITRLPHAKLLSAALSPDGKTAVSLGEDGSIKVWNTSNSQMVRSLADSSAPATRLALSPDGRVAWVAGSDGSLYAWDIVGGTRLGAIKAHRKAAECIAVSADGLCVVSSGADRMVKRWDLSYPAIYRDFEERIPLARKALDSDPQDAAALAAFGEWYAFRGMDHWAIDLLERARAGGAKVRPLTLARCYWRLSENNRAHATSAAREFTRAIEARDAPEPYLRLCLDAVGR